MEQPNDGHADDYSDVCDFIEEVYGNAFWALQAGATKEGLISQIDLAFECLEEMKKDGQLIGFCSCSKTSPIKPSE